MSQILENEIVSPDDVHYKYETEWKTCGVCDDCGEDIYEGDYVYHIDGKRICKRCFDIYIDSITEECEYIAGKE